MSLDPRYQTPLHDAAQALVRAADNLRFTLAGVGPLMPLTLDAMARLTESERERLDSLAVRFSRCQQMAGGAFKALALAEAEPQSRFIDLLALMCKRGLVDSIEVWNRQRDLRNDIGHLYLAKDRDFVDFYNALAVEAPGVIAYAERLQEYLRK
ncbi:MAG: hypothetical protein ABT940_01825 [Alphaproteobacteria bacterium]